ncbi:hypothetical protein D3C81_943260 [compost metagenome]
MALQVGQGIGAEGTDVGHAPTVGGQLGDITLSLVPGFELAALAGDVVGQQVNLAQTLFFVVGQEPYTASVDIQAALDPAPA